MTNAPKTLNAVIETSVKVNLRQVDYSFNEMADMYNEAELIVNPEFQRLFRWDKEKQSRFIESLLLDMPLPPIFVIETEDYKYELIDGLQRISTFLHFRFYNPKTRNQDDTLRLEGCDIVTELNGKTYSDLPAALQTRLKRRPIRVQVIRKESDNTLKYHMFKRLNTGGEILSEQEVRNATIRLLNDTFINFIKSLTDNDDFNTCVSIVSDNKKEKKYIDELVLRYYAFKNYRDNYTHAMDPFLTNYLEYVSDPSIEAAFNYEEEEDNFKRTFYLLNELAGKYAFAAYEGTILTRRFRSLQYDSICIGIQNHLDYIENNITKANEIYNNMKKDEEFIELTTGGGLNYLEHLKRRIQYVNKYFIENK
ncbi:MAG: DUF262 domain-containing protein [Candidatus Coatesbacteria bacterium]|nr:DUF262 domain-containing protein [Candidatus Coatesbacteria bacterium]